MKMITRVLLPAGALLLGISALLAQSPQPATVVPPTEPAATTPKKSARVWLWSSVYSRDDATKIQTGKGGVILRFTRNEMPPDFLKLGKDHVPLGNDDSRLTTDTALYNETTQIATAPGKLKLEDLYNTLTGNTGSAYYKTRDAKIRGDVVIVARPREEDKNAPEGSAQRQFDSPVTLTCQKVDYNWRTRIALASEQLTVKQKDRTVTADHAIYDGKRDTVILEGDVRYTRPNGEIGKAKKATIIYTKGKEKFIAEGEVSASFPVDEEDVEGQNNPAPSASGPGARPAPGNRPTNPSRPPASPVQPADSPAPTTPAPARPETKP